MFGSCRLWESVLLTVLRQGSGGVLTGNITTSISTGRDDVDVGTEIIISKQTNKYTHKQTATKRLLSHQCYLTWEHMCERCERTAEGCCLHSAIKRSTVELRRFNLSLFAVLHPTLGPKSCRRGKKRGNSTSLIA